MISQTYMSLLWNELLAFSKDLVFRVLGDVVMKEALITSCCRSYRPFQHSVCLLFRLRPS